MNPYVCISEDVVLGHDVYISKFVNLYGCTIGNHTKIGAFVEVQKNARIGARCKISSHSFICEGVTILDDCFIGHGVMFINDNHPRSVTPRGELEKDTDWRDRFVETWVEQGVVIGTGAVILGNVRIGAGAVVGAGSVVTKDIPAGEVWVGNPAKPQRTVQAPLPSKETSE